MSMEARDDGDLARVLLNTLTAAIYARVPHPEDRGFVLSEKAWVEGLLQNLRRAWGERRPDVDVSEDVELGRAIERLVWSVWPQ